ncbi:MAG: hypothetical protein ACRDGD_02175 [Candidatus Limnocylindria bacterium]
MPKPVTWEWARPRLMPLLAGPYLDPPGEPLVRLVLPPGIAVAFGIDLGRGVIPYVDAAIAQRWECTPQQIGEAAVTNLERRAARIDPVVVSSGSLSGHIVRLLQRPAGWASSVLLTTEHLKRLFGEHDQLFLAAGHGTLISMAMDAPSHIAHELVFEYESRELYPLLLDPFALTDGELVWGGAREYDEYEYDDDDDDDADPALLLAR